MLQNATPLRKSAPWPPNISDANVSCTAPAMQNASLQVLILFNRPTPAIVFETAPLPPQRHSPPVSLQPSSAALRCFQGSPLARAEEGACSSVFILASTLASKFVVGVHFALRFPCCCWALGLAFPVLLQLLEAVQLDHVALTSSFGHKRFSVFRCASASLLFFSRLFAPAVWRCVLHLFSFARPAVKWALLATVALGFTATCASAFLGRVFFLLLLLFAFLFCGSSHSLFLLAQSFCLAPGRTNVTECRVCFFHKSTAKIAPGVKCF